MYKMKLHKTLKCVTHIYSYVCYEIKGFFPTFSKITFQKSIEVFSEK